MSEIKRCFNLLKRRINFSITMKVLHTSDWHLGNVLHGYDRTVSDASFLAQLEDIVRSQQPDCMIVSGDVYNVPAPSSSVQKLYTDAMLKIHNACKDMTIIVIAGNHDSPAKLEIDRNLWNAFNVSVIGGFEKTDGAVNLSKHVIEIKDTNGDIKGYVAAVPYFYRRNFPDLFTSLQQYIIEINKNNLPVILSAHAAITGSEIKSNSIRMQDMEFTELENLGDIYDYIALGHIHYPQTLQNSDKKARYCGSSIAVSFNEEYKHSVTIVNVDKGAQPLIQTIEIKDEMPVKTVPPAPCPIESVFEYVNENKEQLKNCFLRFNVTVKDFLPPDSKEKSTEICNQIGAYFCTFDIHRQKTSTGEYENKIITAQELKQMTPVTVAENYLKQNGTELSEDFKQMIIQITQTVNKETEL